MMKLYAKQSHLFQLNSPELVLGGELGLNEPEISDFLYHQTYPREQNNGIIQGGPKNQYINSVIPNSTYYRVL